MTETIVESRYEQWLEAVLPQIGIAPMTDDELRTSFDAAIEMIQSGVFDPEEFFEGQGVRPINTLISGYTQEEFDDVPDGKKALVCNFGGTNWKVYVAEKVGGEVVLEEVGNHEFEQDERQFESKEEFIKMMVDRMMAGRTSENLPDQVGIAFGFPLNPEEVDEGVGLVRENGDLGKFWYVDGLGGVNVAKEIVKEAATRGWKINTIVMDNDTINDALAVPGADGGGVGGSGTNFCTRVMDAYGGYLVNLEIGKARKIFEYSRLVEQMEVRGLLGSWGKIAEVYTGGDYLVRQLKTVKEMFGWEWLSDEIVSTWKGGLLSLAAAKDPQVVMETLDSDGIGMEQAKWLKMVSKPILQKAGQALGVMISTAAAVTGQERPKFGVEGEVLLSGTGVLGAMLETAKMLGLDIEIVMAEPMNGLGKYVMVQNAKKVA